MPDASKIFASALLGLVGGGLKGYSEQQKLRQEYALKQLEALPESVRSYEYYKNLPAGQAQADFLNVRRAGQAGWGVDPAGNPYLVQPPKQPTAADIEAAQRAQLRAAYAKKKTANLPSPLKSNPLNIKMTPEEQAMAREFTSKINR